MIPDYQCDTFIQIKIISGRDEFCLSWAWGMSPLLVQRGEHFSGQLQLFLKLFWGLLPQGEVSSAGSPTSRCLGSGQRNRDAPCLLGLLAYVCASGRPVAMEKRWGAVCLARLTFFLARSKGISPALMRRRRLAHWLHPHLCHTGVRRPPRNGRNSKAGEKKSGSGREQRARKKLQRWASAWVGYRVMELGPSQGCTD